MKPNGIQARWFSAPRLTRGRVILALGVATVSDGLQLILGPLGWVGVDEIIDVLAMTMSIALLGFHWLLLPTFVVEWIPVTDMLPTWTGCVSAVIILRKKAQSKPPESTV